MGNYEIQSLCRLAATLVRKLTIAEVIFPELCVNDTDIKKNWRISK